MSNSDTLMSLFQTVPTGVDRPEKGSNLFEFPESFVVIDLETTGFSPSVDQILEFGAIKYQNGKIVDSYSSLVKYEGGSLIDEFITELTGITRDMIKAAPYVFDILPQFIDFIGDSIVIGHNTNFDINFIYDESIRLLGKTFNNNFVDTMRLSRRLHPEEKHHRLSDLADRYSITTDGEHRALSDCKTTLACYKSIHDEAISKYGSIEQFIKEARPLNRGVKASDIIADKSKENFDCIFHDKVCVITGKLDKYTRKEAMQLIADIGGINADGITKKTNFLVLGNMDYCNNIKEGKSNKLKKAEEMKLKGYDIEIIPEDVFYEMILLE